MGIIRRDETSRIITFAKPVGIVGAVQPYTNPIVTPIPRRTRILSASRRSRIILSRDGIKDRPIHGWQWGLVKFREVESKSGGAYEH
jgi:hypothetical protein